MVFMNSEVSLGALEIQAIEHRFEANQPNPAVAEEQWCFHQLFDEQARRTPDDDALVFEGQRLSYAELQQRADVLASRLVTLGVGPEVLVGLFVERSLEMVVGLLAILKAGGAYLPIDPDYPQDRVAFILADAEVPLILTQASLQYKLPPDLRQQQLCLDSFDWSVRSQSARSRDAVAPNNLVYVIYTSGSTGQPKGVCVEHKNIVNYVQSIVKQFKLQPGWSYATVSTIAADLGNTVIFTALASGGCLHVISQERASSQALLAEYFGRETIDVLKIVPSHLAALQTGKHPQQVMPRRCLILGGDSSRVDWIEKLRAMSPDCEIYNHYGPTETTVGVLTYHVGAVLPSTATLPLGRPLPHGDVYILDKWGATSSPGVAGEIYIQGRGVARGYLNRPELTSEKFVIDPYSSDMTARLYRTGDMARVLPDGNIEFCGRIDDQVKISGYRVELGEIEKALRLHAGIQDVVVLASDAESSDRQLLAYVLPKRAHQPLWDAPSVHVLPDGMAVAHLNRNETDYIYQEIFVLQAYLRHGIAINAGDTIVDAGSNIGLFTVFASRLAKDLRIYSFEPNPAAFSCLKANAEAWGCGVKCLQVGLSSENKSAEMTFFEGLSLLSGYYADAAVEHNVVKNYVANQQGGDDYADEIDALISERLRAKTIPTHLKTLSSVIADEGIERIDLLKVNVEKSELDVLKGIRPGDWPKIRQLVIEVDQQEAIEPIQNLLALHGFNSLIEQDPLLVKTELCYIYAIRPSMQEKYLAPQPDRAAHLRQLAPVAEDILTPATLRGYLKERLPPYMLPSAFILLDKIPLTSNGKVDRHALPLFSGVKKHVLTDSSEPKTATEKKLAAIWSDLLKVEKIGMNDDFFDLGGQSLTAIKVVSRVKDVFGVNMPLRNIFDHPTICGQAEVIDGLLWLARGPMASSGDREEMSL